jgi:hypothetical protein
LADFCRLTYLPDFLAVHTRVLIEQNCRGFPPLPRRFQLIKRSPNV